MLGTDITGLFAARDQAMRGSNIDDTAKAALLHSGHHGLDGVESSRQIDCNDGIPPVIRKGFNGSHVMDAGIIHQNVDRAEFTLRSLDHPTNVLRL